MRKHVVPKWSAKLVAEITAEDISRLHHELRHVPISANRVMSILSKAFNLSETWGWRPRGSNPVKGIERFRDRKRTRRMTPGEVRSLATAMQQAFDGNHDQARTAVLIWLLLFTGARRGEIMSSRWDWIKWDRGILALPDSKTGEKEVALPDPALAVLKRWQSRCPSGAWVIPGDRHNAPLCSPRRGWMALKKAAGVPLDIRIHDLRRTFASAGLGAGIGLSQIGELLGHQSAQTTKIYAALMDDPKRQAAATTASQLEAWIGPTK